VTEGDTLPTVNGSSPDRRDAVMSVGDQLRESRKAAGISLRQFARNLGVSPSFISQIENGKSQPSVATLYMICSELNLSVDELFAKAGAAGGEGEPPRAAAGSAAGRPAAVSATSAFHGALAELTALQEPAGHASPVVTPAQRRRLVLDSGVTWEQLSPTREAAVDFLFVRYAVGGSSVANNELTRHSGVEYGYIISGTLEISLGFETYSVSAGESISFDSSTPHRLTNTGDVPVEAIWFVHGRNSSHEH
jgi:transcriptional regulator with XRE-family HTH domain